MFRRLTRLNYKVLGVLSAELLHKKNVLFTLHNKKKIYKGNTNIIDFSKSREQRTFINSPVIYIKKNRWKFFVDYLGSTYLNRYGLLNDKKIV
jgi:hypothetical protein